MLVQFTEEAAHIIEVEGKHSVENFDSQIGSVEYDGRASFFVASNNTITKYTLNGPKLERLFSKTFDSDIACMNLSCELGVLLLGFWNASENIRVISSENLEVTTKTRLQSMNVSLSYVPRSALIMSFENQHWFALVTTQNGNSGMTFGGGVKSDVIIICVYCGWLFILLAV